jgi:hypothetical protein
MSAAEVVALRQTYTGLTLTLLLSGHIFRLLNACWILHHLRKPNYSMYKRSLMFSRHGILCKYLKSYEISEQTVLLFKIHPFGFLDEGGGGGGSHPKFWVIFLCQDRSFSVHRLKHCYVLCTYKMYNGVKCRTKIKKPRRDTIFLPWPSVSSCLHNLRGRCFDIRSVTYSK